MRRPGDLNLVELVTPEEFNRRPRPAASCVPVVERITVVLDVGSATVYLPEIEPPAMRAAVDAAAAAGELGFLGRRQVDIICADPARVAAFVYAAKPWLRIFAINGRAVVPAPAN